MTRPFAFALTICLNFALAFAVQAQTAQQPGDSPLIRPAGDAHLEDFVWLFRPVIIFADTEADPRYGEQMDRLRAEIDELAKRDVIVLTDTEPAARSPLRQKLHPRGFQFVLVGKDGRVLLRKPNPWSVREITRSIDKLPTRKREIRERRGDG